MSICAHAGQDIGYMHYMTMSEHCFLAREGREDSVAGPSQHTYLQSQVHKRLLNEADSRQL